ncbi:hypothetical protein MLD38_026356 [Melastoma candidum]|uniref:Uncharacterized protein n=1 Tax=Melastoma candidum TaxID=119954 RepID=A0ACB9NZW7_9MYRT|nr:hypothetical protein MLD38_026356 [Melastoma candidum]
MRSSSTSAFSLDPPNGDRWPKFDDEYDDGEEGGRRPSSYGYKPSPFTVALCPCLFCVLLVIVVLSIALTFKFRLFCHTPLGKVIYKRKC